jgi:membrane-associated phospholipid phosphatase
VKALAIVLALASAANAEPWYRGKYGNRRILHISITVGGAGLYALSETVFKPQLTSSSGRWSSVDSLDQTVRNDVVWKNTALAGKLSNYSGYIATPLYTLGLTVAGSLTSDDPDWTRVLDDGVPVMETIVLAELVDQAAKFAFARQRPYAHYSPPLIPGIDDNVSFFSGHTTLVFGLATSAGMVAHRRRYWTEPYIWIGGGVLAASTAYLRMAADEHYLSDVVTGAAVGITAGLLVPKMSIYEVEVVPTGRGAAIAGTF